MGGQFFFSLKLELDPILGKDFLVFTFPVKNSKKYGELMESEKQVIQTFKKLFEGKTLTELSDLTNIQRTRLFRVLNGAELKLKEAQSINKLIYGKVGDGFSRMFYKTMGLEIIFGEGSKENSTREKNKRELAYLYYLTEGKER